MQNLSEIAVRVHQGEADAQDQLEFDALWEDTDLTDSERLRCMREAWGDPRRLRLVPIERLIERPKHTFVPAPDPWRPKHYHVTHGKEEYLPCEIKDARLSSGLYIARCCPHPDHQPPRDPRLRVIPPAQWQIGDLGQASKTEVIVPDPPLPMDWHHPVPYDGLDSAWDKNQINFPSNAKRRRVQ